MHLACFIVSIIILNDLDGMTTDMLLSPDRFIPPGTLCAFDWFMWHSLLAIVIDLFPCSDCINQRR